MASPPSAARLASTDDASQAVPARSVIRLLCAVFFLSGVSSLLFETLWFHQAGLVLGNSIWTSSLVLAGFMGGLAIGNGLTGSLGSRVRKPVQLYAVLELIIGFTGAGIVFLLPHVIPLLTPVFRAVLDQAAVLNGVRLGVAFALLLIPSIAMGATLPFLVAVVVRRDARFGRALGQLYGWNTLGAVAGALIGELWLVKWLGIRATALTATTLNVLVAWAALRLSQATEVSPQRPARVPTRVRLSTRASSLLGAAAVSGAILLALEVVWFRFLLLFVDGTSLIFAVMLSIVLAGIGAGGLLGSRWLSAQRDAHRALPYVALVSGAVSLLCYAQLDGVVTSLHGYASTRWVTTLQLSVPLMFPVSMLSGVLFTLLGEAFHRAVAEETYAAGLLTLANTAGAMAGSIAGAVLLLPRFGVDGSIRLLSAGYGLVAACAVLGGARPETPRGLGGLAVALGLFVLTYVVVPPGLLWARYLMPRLHRYAKAELAVPVATREGLTETIILLERSRFGVPLSYRMLTNSYSMSSTGSTAQRYMKLFVYLPVALHPKPRQALLISYGVGSTAKALTDTGELERIDVVDTSKDILELSRTIYPDPATNPLRDPRVRVHVEDGRFFLQTTDRRFDLITGEPPPPRIAGIVNLYTQEYFALLKSRLAAGGMVTYWFPAHQLPARDGLALLRAFCNVFDDCSLWEGSTLDWVLLGTNHASGPVSMERFRRQWRDVVVGPELVALGFETPEQLGALFMYDADDLRALTRGTAPVTDDYPKQLSAASVSWTDQVDFYRPWMDARRARERFLRSALIARLWPALLREASIDDFDTQDLINAHFLDGVRDPIDNLQVVHGLLTNTTLRTLPLWRFNGSKNEERALSAALALGQRTPEIDYRLAVQALVDRNYGQAETHFSALPHGGANEREVLYTRLYVLCMSGRFEDAKQLMAAHGIFAAGTPTDQRFLRFLSAAFGPAVAIEPR